MLEKINIIKTTSLLIKNQKRFVLSYNILDPLFYLHYLKFTIFLGRFNPSFHKYKMEYLILYQTIVKMFIINQNQYVQLISNIESQYNSNKLIIPYNIVTPNTITRFAKQQLNNNNIINLNFNGFNTNVQRHLLKYINYILFELKHDVIGLKIICVGK